MTEQEMREAKVPTFETIEELNAYINGLISQQHDYGTCVYAMSMSAEAAYNYVASKLGVTGFQASCADMDFIRRTRLMKSGFQILNFENLLYPQYLDEEHFPSFNTLITKHAEMLSKAAKEKLAEADEFVHPNVKAHWKMLANLKTEGAQL